jgi:hypothetical protein
LVTRLSPGGFETAFLGSLDRWTVGSLDRWTLAVDGRRKE